ncbi:MAG: hypothetical protein JST06_04950 [Bacteroidetes bacterium]|nr:hypothetical protein [Bacteroidota bacterium]MBS1630795.1 hypothetical protein [Bacteroidota bacterium]
MRSFFISNISLPVIRCIAHFGDISLCNPSRKTLRYTHSHRKSQSAHQHKAIHTHWRG